MQMKIIANKKPNKQFVVIANWLRTSNINLKICFYFRFLKYVDKNTIQRFEINNYF